VVPTTAATTAATMAADNNGEKGSWRNGKRRNAFTFLEIQISFWVTNPDLQELQKETIIFEVQNQPDRG
jgi:hypothetical protein